MSFLLGAVLGLIVGVLAESGFDLTGRALAKWKEWRASRKGDNSHWI